MPDEFKHSHGGKWSRSFHWLETAYLLCRSPCPSPRILILDETISNVDPATEQIIQRAIIILLQGRTSNIVAHRLSTIQK